MKITRICLLLAALLATFFLNAQELKLHHLFTSHAVLQQEAVVPVTGWGKPGASVLVSASWCKKPVTTKVQADGTWRADVPTREASCVPQQVVVRSGKEEIVLSDILIGEVWVCSGQSNMQMPLGGWDHQRVADAYETIRDAASTPLIRMYTVERNTALDPGSAPRPPLRATLALRLTTLERRSRSSCRMSPWVFW